MPAGSETCGFGVQGICELAQSLSGPIFGHVFSWEGLSAH